MIPDIGWVELLIIAAVAIIVVGPKDLPRMMRIIGGWVGKARGLAREFQRSFDDLIKESELDDLRKEVEELRALNPIDDIKKALDPTDQLRELDKSLKDEMSEVEAGMKEKAQPAEPAGEAEEAPEEAPEKVPEDPDIGEDPVEDPSEDLQSAQADIEAGRGVEPSEGDEASAVKP